MAERRPVAFVLMPFATEFDVIYTDLIMPTLIDTGYEVRRADDIFNQRNILRDIVEQIASCDLVVADLTGLNANVFYELGIAHATQRPTVLLTQDLSELPFDLRSYRVIEYDTHFARVHTSIELLSRTASGARDGSLQFGSPFSDFMVSNIDQAGPIQAESDEGAQPGWLDHLASIEEGYQELTEALSAISTSTQGIGEEARRASERLDRAKATAGPSRTGAMRAIAADFGKRMLDFAGQLTRENERYENVLKNTGNSTEVIISKSQINDADDRRALQSYVETLRSVRQTATTTRGQIAGMRESVRGVEGIERTSTQAARAAGAQLDRLISNIEQTVASADRGIEVGERRLAADTENAEQREAPSDLL